MFIPCLFQSNSCFFFWLRKDPNQQHDFMVLCPPDKEDSLEIPPTQDAIVTPPGWHSTFSLESQNYIFTCDWHSGWEVDRKDSWQLFFSAGPLNSERHESTKVAIIAASSCTRRIGYGYLMCQNSGLFIATYSAGWSPLIWWFSEGILYRKWPKHSG